MRIAKSTEFIKEFPNATIIGIYSNRKNRLMFHRTVPGVPYGNDTLLNKEQLLEIMTGNRNVLFLGIMHKVVVPTEMVEQYLSMVRKGGKTSDELELLCIKIAKVLSGKSASARPAQPKPQAEPPQYVPPESEPEARTQRAGECCESKLAHLKRLNREHEELHAQMIAIRRAIGA